MAEHETRVRNPSRKEVEAALALLDFPLDKEALVASVRAREQRRVRASTAAGSSARDVCLGRRGTPIGGG